MQGWVANRLAYQRAIPRKDGAILSNCPDPEVRRKWIQRIIDHDGTREGEGGIEKWIQLGIAFGVPREEMEDERHVLPGVRFAAEMYVTFCKTRPWVEAAASSLTELFAPDIMRRRLDALPDALSVDSTPTRTTISTAVSPRRRATAITGSRSSRRIAPRPRRSSARSRRSRSRSRCCG